MRGSRRCAAVLLAALLVTSGCSFLGGGPIEFAASPASVCSDALSATGYATDVSTWANRSGEVTVAGETRTLRLSNYVNGYVREVDGQTRGGFVLLSTPTAPVAGQALNPVRGLSPRDLAESLEDELDQYGQLSVLERVGTEEVTVLGTTATRTRFGATATDGSGDPVDVYVSVLRVEHESDFVIVGSVHEQSNPDEGDRFDRLRSCVEHAGVQPEYGGTPTGTPGTG